MAGTIFVASASFASAPVTKSFSMSMTINAFIGSPPKNPAHLQINVRMRLGRRLWCASPIGAGRRLGSRIVFVNLGSSQLDAKRSRPLMGQNKLIVTDNAQVDIPIRKHDVGPPS